jgi:hypothetical protein
MHLEAHAAADPLVIPDLLQDRLAKLTEYAAHLDTIIGAIAQHVLRVATLVATASGYALPAGSA